jgi:putative Mg2+ transporter-C (MgtC) family protein
MNLPEYVVQCLEYDFTKLVIALVLTIPVAYNRENATKIMGLRTFPLVAIATCGFILISNSFIEPSSEDARARVLQGILSGIGFIGGGAILKKGDRVLGTASAASIWTTGAIGVAVAYAKFDIALFLAFANFGILHWLTRFKSKSSKSDDPD